MLPIKSTALLTDYIKYSVSRINMFLNAVRENVPDERWTTDSKEPNRLLTVTFINSFLITMRMLIEKKHNLDFSGLKSALSGFEKFDTRPYSSSQYNRMAEQIIKKYFSI